MNKTLSHFAVATLLLIFAGTASAADLESLSGWQNQSGSTFSIDTYDPSSGLFSGSYINRAQGTGCQNTPYGVTGYILGNIISWSVRWQNAYQNCSSATGWTGYYANGVITTNWNLAYQTSGGYAIAKGTDTFTRVTQTKSKFLMK